VSPFPSCCLGCILTKYFLALRSQLGLPLGSSDSKVADSCPRSRLLCRGLGCYALDLNAFQQDTYLAFTCLRRRSRSPEMVPGKTFFTTHDACRLIRKVTDALGNFLSSPLYTVGRSRWTIPWDLIVALVRCSRCHPGCRAWHDTSSGTKPLHFIRHTLILTDAQTLSRLHVCATLAFSQVIGSICVMVARATAPDRIGPGSVFPDASKWDFNQGLKGTVQLRLVGVVFLTFFIPSGSPMALPLFWLALISQIIIVLGYFWFYRKEQLCEWVRFIATS
jgi:hypothetical protein